MFRRDALGGRNSVVSTRSCSREAVSPPSWLRETWLLTVQFTQLSKHPPRRSSGASHDDARARRLVLSRSVEMRSADAFLSCQSASARGSGKCVVLASTNLLTPSATRSDILKAHRATRAARNTTTRANGALAPKVARRTRFHRVKAILAVRSGERVIPARRDSCLLLNLFRYPENRPRRSRVRIRRAAAPPTLGFAMDEEGSVEGASTLHWHWPGELMLHLGVLRKIAVAEERSVVSA